MQYGPAPQHHPRRARRPWDFGEHTPLGAVPRRPRPGLRGVNAVTPPPAPHPHSPLDVWLFKVLGRRA